MNKQELLHKIQFLYQQHNWKEMETLCSEGLKLFPNSASTHYNRAIARANMESYEAAKQDLEKALKIRASLKEAQILLEKIVKKIDTR